MPITGHSYGDATSRYGDNATTEMSSKEKIAFGVTMVTVILFSMLVAYCVVVRKQRLVTPGPSAPHYDEEEGHETRGATVIVA